MDIITDIFQRFDDQISSGFGLIQGDVNWLLGSLIIINIVLSAMFWAFSEDEVIAQIARKVLFIGAIVWIVQNWPMLTDILSRTFIALGIKASGTPIGSPDALNPAQLVIRGFGTVEPMILAMRDLSGPIGFFENFPEIILLTVAVLLILIAFAVMAIQLVVALLSFKLGTLVAFVLVPFSLFKPTSFIAERPLGWVVAASVRLMLLTIVLGIGEAAFVSLEIDWETLTVVQALGIAIGAVLLMVLALLSGRLASEIVSGQPNLSGNDAIATSANSARTAHNTVRNTTSAARRAIDKATTLD